MIYPGILIFMIAVITVSSLLTIKFLTSGINAAFDINQSAFESGIVKTNVTSYKLTAKKLNLTYPVNTALTPPLPDSQEQQ